MTTDPVVIVRRINVASALTAVACLVMLLPTYPMRTSVSENSTRLDHVSWLDPSGLLSGGLFFIGPAAVLALVALGLQLTVVRHRRSLHAAFPLLVVAALVMSSQTFFTGPVIVVYCVAALLLASAAVHATLP